MTPFTWSLSIALAAAAAFDPAGIADQSTIELRTVTPDEGEHWSTVWFVVVDGLVYVRLGPRAADRIDENSTAPRMEVRVSGGETYAMRYEKAPEMAERIAAAMADKYWSDVLGEPFRRLGLTSPPLMLRLIPESGADESRASTVEEMP
jgi:hypothetical protein